MKAYTYTEKGRFEMAEKPRPEILDPKDAIVRVTLSSICSSDLHIKHGSVQRAVPGITVGHEMVGIVEDVDPDVKVIGIDEAQFFDESIVEVVRTLANKGVRVIIAGLDTDFLAQPFGPMPALMAIAEDVQKVHAICVKCGALANHSHRLSKSDELVVLGEKDIYEPLCRECYNLAIQK